MLSQTARQVKHVCVVLILVILGALLLLRSPVSLPVRGFILVMLLMLPANAYWWAWGMERINSPAGSRQGRRRCQWMSIAWSGYMALMLLPLPLWMLTGRAVFDRLPSAAFTWVLAWHLIIIALGGTAAVVSAGVFLLRRLKVSRRLPERPFDLARRRFMVQTALAAPIVLTGAAVARGHAGGHRPRIRRVAMALPRLPERLRGLTITHLTDLHAGRFFGASQIEAAVDAANSLKSDLVVVTGDIIDHDIDYLPIACDGIENLEHRYGRLLVVGNHDLFDSPADVLHYLGHREPHLLNDRYLPITIGGERIQVAGLFWSRQEGPVGRDPGHRARAAAALKGRDPGLFTMALVHHPHAFDVLAAHDVDLTLAGHTHGGQIMLTPPGAPFPLGAGNLIFRYIWGEYRRGDSALHVSAGVGNWFPVRINAPAEIVQIQLT